MRNFKIGVRFMVCLDTSIKNMAMESTLHHPWFSKICVLLGFSEPDRGREVVEAVEAAGEEAVLVVQPSRAMIMTRAAMGKRVLAVRQIQLWMMQIITGRGHRPKRNM